MGENAQEATDSPWCGLKISKRMSQILAGLGIDSALGLLLHFPIRYEDRSKISPIVASLAGETILARVEVLSVRYLSRPRKMMIVSVQDTLPPYALISMRFFHFYPAQKALFKPGKLIRAFGSLQTSRNGELSFVHPQCQDDSEVMPGGTLVPVYPVAKGLSQQAIRKWILALMPQVECLFPEPLPASLLKSLGLEPIVDGIRILHSPPESLHSALSDLSERAHPIWDRVKFDELLAQQILLALVKKERQSVGEAMCLTQQSALAQQLEASISFQLTAAQKRVYEEIVQDIAKPIAMQRLLQGDVGSGKTIVAALILCHCVDSGGQAVLLAPTEILAQQHYQKLYQWLQPLGVEVFWLSGKQNRRSRRDTLEAAVQGIANIVVGTHAIFQENVSFKQLALVIIDEQHRFGVEQRWRMVQKGQAVHTLMTTATPIPRTLSMSYYADLDVSVLDQLPPGRLPVETYLIDLSRKTEIFSRLEHIFETGGQAYWVCPLIEESDVLQLQTVEESFEQLQAALPKWEIGVLHSRVAVGQKEAVMADFIANKIQMLVATTVIEVGVDVPNANVMIIENAERFGLSQLHQLRGRIGRGHQAGCCLLLYQSPVSNTAQQRLQVMRHCTDGFEIADQDLQIRGPGEFLSAKQTGFQQLKHADLRQDKSLLQASRHAAQTLIAQNEQDAIQWYLEHWLKGKAEFLQV